MVNINYTRRAVVPDKETKKGVRKNSENVKNNDKRLDELEAKFEKLALVTESLWELLKQETSLTEEQFECKVAENISNYEERSKAKTKCHNCNQFIPSAKTKCFYCGVELEESKNISPFAF